MNRCKMATGLLGLALAVLFVIPAQAFPPAGYDNVSTSAEINIYDPVDSSILIETVILTGDAVIWRGDEYDPGDGRMTVDTRLDTLLLRGFSLNAGDSIFATLNRSKPAATGWIKQVNPGVDFPAESFFDVYYQITYGSAPNPPSPAGGVQGKLQYDLQSGIGQAMLATAQVSTGLEAPVKAPYTGPANKEDANVARQGGDDVTNPTVIAALPYTDFGVTTGFTDDYDEVCPSTSTSPDVVYSFVAPADTFIIIDLCGAETDYDTKVFVYETAVGNLVACNDDACANQQTQFASRIECFPVLGGTRYYIIIDGWDGAFGMYELLVDYCSGLPCVVDCPAGASFEDEPCGQDTNGGCNSQPPAFTPIQCGERVCGTAWADGGSRDTDWYELVLTQNMTVDFTVVCEFPGLIGLVESINPGSGDCADNTGQLVPFAFGNACDTLSISMSLGAGIHWLFVAPSLFVDYPCATGPWDYVATVTCTPDQVTWINPDSVHMIDTIWQIPPHGRVYVDPRKTPVIDPATGDTVGWLWHKHIVDPPPGGNDTIPTTGWMDVWVGPNPPAPTQQPDEVIQVDGQTILGRGDPEPLPEGGHTVQTEILSMDLSGESALFGPVILSLPQPAPGQSNSQGPEFWPMGCFYDVPYILDFPAIGQTIEPLQPPHMQSEGPVNSFPPEDLSLADPNPHPVHDIQNPGVIIGWVRPIHWLPPPPPPNPSGACCETSTGICFIAPATQCVGPGLVYQGDNTSCVPNPCVDPNPSGACCELSTGICFITPASQCVGAGLAYQGDNTSCVPNPCVDTCASQNPGDFNSDGVINTPDLTGLLAYVECTGPPPVVLSNADVNGDCVVNQADVDYLTAFLFAGGPPPVDCTCLNPTPPDCNDCTGWEAGVDTILFSTFSIDVFNPADSTDFWGTMVAYGSTMIVQRGAPYEVSPGIWRMDTEILQLTGAGNSALFGPFTLDLDPNNPSLGFIEMCDSCNDTWASSEFTVNYVITTSLAPPDNQLTGSSTMELPCSAGWDPSTPPHGHQYVDPRKVPIYDASGQIIGYTMKRHAVSDQPPCTHWTPGVDTILFSTFSIDVFNPADSTDFWGTLTAYGTTMIVQRAAPYESSPNIWRMDTEILQLTGAGNSAIFGPFTINLDPTQPSLGFIEQCDSCDDNWARSEFGVNYVITTTLGPPMTTLTGSSLMELPCDAQWNPGDPFGPPNGHQYVDPRKVPIFDASGQIIGYTMKRHAVSDQPPCTHWTPGLDTIIFSTFLIEYFTAADTVNPADTLVAYGANMVVQRGAPFEETPNIWRMNTTVVEFSGSGWSPILGAFQIDLDPNSTSTGFIRQCDSCTDYWAESELNIVYVITTNLPPPMDTVQSDTAKMVLPCSAGWDPGDPFGPPNGHSYVDPRKVPIYDADGTIIGYIWKQHRVGTPNPDVGACCFGPDCVITDAVTCEQQGGQYQGDGTSCTPDPCGGPVTGACCLSDGTCQELLQIECEQLQGVYEGDGVSCATVNCDECCNHDGIRGDVDGSGGLDVADLTYIVDYLFRGGPVPPCAEEADPNGSGGIDVADLSYIVDYLFRGGPPPLPCILLKK